MSELPVKNQDMSFEGQSKTKKSFYNSEELFKGGREIEIQHQNVSYRLIITKTGKLVLNK